MRKTIGCMWVVLAACASHGVRCGDHLQAINVAPHGAVEAAPGMAVPERRDSTQQRHVP